MLHVLHGTDFKPLRKKLHTLQEALEERRPDAEFFTIDDESFSPSKLEEFIQSQGLFENKYIVTLDRCFLNEEAKEEILQRIEEIADSPHAFILVEGDVEKNVLKNLKNHAQQVWSFNHSKPRKKDEYKIFSLTDAFGARSRKDVWVEYQKALSAGKDPAAIHGMLFWQVKSIILAQETKSAEEAGMSAYPYKKATSFAENFSRSELYSFSSELVELYHEARSGEFDLAPALEQWLLDL